MSLRIDKINSAVAQNISELLAREIAFKPGVFVTVGKVDTSKDLRYTRIFISVFPANEKDYVEATLKKEIYRLQGNLIRKMPVKIVPRLQFMIEDTQEKVSQLDELFDQIQKEDKGGN